MGTVANRKKVGGDTLQNAKKKMELEQFSLC